MVGTAVAFNLQSHAALIVIGTQLGGFTQVWHDLGVHVLAGIAYVFALLLFPDGSIDRSRGPHLMGLAVFFGLFSFFAIADHTSALVLLFGVLVPAAALLAHSRRFREAQSPELRQLYRLLGVAMGVSLVGAVAVLTVTSVLKSSDERFTETTARLRARRRRPRARTSSTATRTPTDMVGHGHRRRSRPRRTDGTRIVPIEAHGSRFDKDEHRARGRADQRDPVHQHRRDRAQRLDLPRRGTSATPCSIGELFTGQDLATFTFRVFRIVFAIIPIALFVAILRYHLWDVDRLVNRAMVYGALTGVLGLLYAAGALVVGLVPGAPLRPGRARRRVDPGRGAALPSDPAAPPSDDRPAVLPGEARHRRARWRPSPPTCATRSTSISSPTSSSRSCRTRCTRRWCRSGSATVRARRRRDVTTRGARREVALVALAARRRPRRRRRRPRARSAPPRRSTWPRTTRSSSTCSSTRAPSR